MCVCTRADLRLTVGFIAQIKTALKIHMTLLFGITGSSRLYRKAQGQIFKTRGLIINMQLLYRAIFLCRS